MFPIVSYSGNAALEYVTTTWAHRYSMSMSASCAGSPIPARWVKVRLIIYDKDSSNKTIKDIKEQEVYAGRS